MLVQVCESLAEPQTQKRETAALSEAMTELGAEDGNNRNPEQSACFTVKNIGKPCAGKPHARFDEGGLAKLSTVKIVRHRQTKGAANR